MSTSVVSKFIRKPRQQGSPATPQRSRACAATRLELFIPKYTSATYGQVGEPTRQMLAKVCGPYHLRDELNALMKKYCGRNATIIAKFKPPLPKVEQHII